MKRIKKQFLKLQDQKICLIERLVYSCKLYLNTKNNPFVNLIKYFSYFFKNVLLNKPLIRQNLTLY